MKIAVIGAGSIVPTAKRFGTGVYIKTKEASFIIDLGPGVLERLRRLHIIPQDIDAFFLTHFHLDHISDMPPLIMLWAYDRDGNPAQNPKPLQLVGPKGLARLVENIVIDIDAFSYLSKMMGCMRYVKIREMGDGGIWNSGGVKVVAAEVEHYNSLAYRFETSEGTVVFSGDTVPDERLVKLSRGCDVLIHECSFPHDKLLGKHTSEKQLAEIVSKVSPKTLIVTHLYPLWQGIEDRIVEAVKETAIKNLVIAKDMSVIEI